MKNKIKKIIGAILLILVFIILMIPTVIDKGILIAAVSLGTVVLMFTMVIVGMNLLLDNNGPWIEVSSGKLPDANTSSVLIYTEKGGVAEGRYHQSTNKWEQYRWNVEDAQVVAWRHMPKSPKFKKK